MPSRAHYGIALFAIVVAVVGVLVVAQLDGRNRGGPCAVDQWLEKHQVNGTSSNGSTHNQEPTPPSRGTSVAQLNPAVIKEPTFGRCRPPLSRPPPNNSARLPWYRRVHMTHYALERVPQKVFDTLDTLAPEFEIHLYNDADCEAYLLHHYGPRYVAAFRSFPVGAHKADLFRYCLLFQEGGVYLDIKTMLTQPLAPLVTGDSAVTVFSVNERTIYQGILMVPPRTTTMYRASQLAMETEATQENYAVFTEQLYDILCEEGEVEGEGPQRRHPIPAILDHTSMVQARWTLWQETREQCGILSALLPDKYGGCFVVRNTLGKVIMNIRYSDYPW